MASDAILNSKIEECAQPPAIQSTLGESRAGSVHKRKVLGPVEVKTSTDVEDVMTKATEPTPENPIEVRLRGGRGLAGHLGL